MKKQHVKKWIWSILGTIISVVLLGQAMLLFFGDEVLKESILLGFRRYTEQSYDDDKRPTLDFDNLSINLFTGNITVSGLYYAGDVSIDDSSGRQADHIKLLVPEASIQGLGFFDLYKHRELRLEEIFFDQPEIQFISASRTDSTKLSSKRVIQTLTAKFQQHLREYLRVVSFDAFKIWDGNIFVTEHDGHSVQGNPSQMRNKFHAQHVNFNVYDFLLDSLSLKRKDRVFFTKDIEVQLGDYQLLLSDSTYLLKADTLGFSTKLKKIYLKELRMLPVASSLPNEFRITVPEVSLTDIDWRNIYFDSLLVANQLIFSEPSVAIHIRQDSLRDNAFARLDALHPDSLYNSISAKLRELHINEVVFRKGNLQVHQYAKDTLELLHIEETDLSLAHLRLHSNVSQDAFTMILPVDTIALNVAKLKIYLPDRRHYFTAEKASLYTDHQRNFACDVHFDALRFKSGVDALEDLLLAPPSQPLTYDVNISSASFYGIQLETIARERAALLDSICIQRPQVKIANFAPQSVGKQASLRFQQQAQIPDDVPESVKSLVYDWSNAQLKLSPIIAPGDSSALFQWLKAGSLRIDSGQFQILKAKEDLSAFTQITSIHTFDALLENISIDQLTQDSVLAPEDRKVAVLATDVELMIQKSKFLLPGEKKEGGLLEVEEARISSFSEEAHFRNINFRTNPANPPSTEVSLHNMHIPSIQFNGIDLKKIYQEQEGEVAYLLVHSPQITLNYRENDQVKRELNFDFEDLYPQLSFYLDKLSIPSASINNAKLLLQKISSKGAEPLFMTNKLDIQLKGFYLDSLTHMSKIRPFYADLLEVRAENYQWNFYPEDETYPLLGVKGANIHFNSYEGQLDMSNLTMMTNITNRPDLHSLQIYCDKIMADDIDPYYLIHDQRLQVGRVIITGPSYQVEERLKSENVREKVLSRQSLQPDLNKLLSKSLQNIHLRYVNVEKGKLTYLQKLDMDTLSFVSVDSVEFKARNIRVNHQKERHLHNILYADEIDFGFFTKHLLVNRGDRKHKVMLKDAYFSSSDSRLTVGKLEIRPPEDVYSFKENVHIALNSSNLRLRGLDFKRAYLYGDFNVQQLSITQSDLKIYLTARQNESKAGVTSIHEIISPYLENLHVEEFIYPQSKLEIYDKDSRKLMVNLPKVKANLSNFSLDQDALDQQMSSTLGTQPTAAGHLFFAEAMKINIQDYERSLDDGLYRLSADAIDIELGKQKIEVSGLKLQPQLRRTEFLKKFEYSKTLAHLYVDQIDFNEVDFAALLEKGQFIVGHVNVYEPTLEVFRDNHLPRDASKSHGLHQELLFKMKHLMTIHRLQITDGLITYAERAKDAEEDGIITFESLNATASHLTNDPAAIQDSLVTTLDIDALVMGEGKLKTSFRFPLADRNLKFYVNGSLGKMDLMKFNQILEPVAFVHIKEGINQEMRFNFSGDREKSKGTMIFRYNDLSIQMLDREKGNRGLDKKLGSFIANTFVLKANNPKAVYLRIGNITHQRDTSRAMFHYWWQSMLSGVKSSIGIDKNMEKIKDFAELERN